MKHHSSPPLPAYMDLADFAWREYGCKPPSTLRNIVQRDRIRSLVLSETKAVHTQSDNAVTCVEIDPASNCFVLMTTINGTISIYRTGEEAPIENPYYLPKICGVNNQHPNAHRICITDAAWYPHDSGLFVTGSVDKHVKVWDPNTMQMASQFKLMGKVSSVSISDEALVAAASSEGTVRLCDLASGSFTHTISGHDGPVNAVEWLPCSDRLLVSGGADGSIHLWDTRFSHTPVKTLDQEDGVGLVVNPHMIEFARARIDGTDPLSDNLRRQADFIARSRWSAGYGVPKPIAPIYAHGGLPVFGLRFSRDGRYLVTAGGDSKVRLWSVHTMRHSFVHYERLSLKNPTKVCMSNDAVTVFIPSGHDIRRFNVSSGASQGMLRGHYGRVRALAFNRRTCELISGGDHGEVLVWSPQQDNDVLESGLHLSGGESSSDVDD